ncbi:MAG: oxygen-dependent coproporphyrinogen oxidase [Planctomycetota bacterium]|jgi:coproporphyrinogen III oxidase
MNKKAPEYFKNLQDEIVAGLEKLDGKKFHEDIWERKEGGGGRTRVLSDGNLFEKAGVNFSEVYGEFSEDFAKSMPGDGLKFIASGVSLVLHPHNPFIPTVHANFRYISRGTQGWFGGGGDLTPYYPFTEDAIHFHRTWKSVCDRHSSVADYSALKKWCDEYFYLPHRKEARGIGGIFFDYLNANDKSWDFVQDAGKQFLNSYVPIALRRKDLHFTAQQKEFQEYRRGRYVEFNLVIDRGTIFGLKTGGRIESILMSLPAKARWWYDFKPEAGSPEHELTEFYLKPKDWASMTIPKESSHHDIHE